MVTKSNFESEKLTKIDKRTFFPETIEYFKLLLEVFKGGEKGDNGDIKPLNVAFDKIEILASPIIYSSVIAVLETMRISNLYERVKESDITTFFKNLTEEQQKLLIRSIYKVNIDDGQKKIETYDFNELDDEKVKEIMNAIRNMSAHLNYELGWKGEIDSLTDLKVDDIYIIFNGKTKKNDSTKWEMAMPVEELLEIVDCFEAIVNKKNGLEEIEFGQETVNGRIKLVNPVIVEYKNIGELFDDSEIISKREKGVLLSEREIEFLENQINNLGIKQWERLVKLGIAQEYLFDQINYLNSCTVKPVIGVNSKLHLTKSSSELTLEDGDKRDEYLTENFDPIHTRYIRALHRIATEYIRELNTISKMQKEEYVRNEGVKIGIADIAYFAFLSEEELKELLNEKDEENFFSGIVRKNEEFSKKIEKSLMGEEQENGQFLIFKDLSESSNNLMLAQVLYRMRMAESLKSNRDILYMKTLKTLAAYTLGNIKQTIDELPDDEKPLDSELPDELDIFKKNASATRSTTINKLRNSIWHSRNKDNFSLYYLSGNLEDIGLEFFDKAGAIDIENKANGFHKKTYENHQGTVKQLLELIEKLKKSRFAEMLKPETSVDILKKSIATDAESLRQEESFFNGVTNSGIDKKEFLKGAMSQYIAISEYKDCRNQMKRDIISEKIEGDHDENR